MAESAFLIGDEVPDYLRGVELMTAGMEWPAMTGPVTITVEHIADAIVAANEDPHVQVPRIKLGHSSVLNGSHPDHDPYAAIGDAEPAFGQFHNLAATNDGAVLVGDATNVLTWLAEVAPAAYPNRSSEATWEVAGVDFDVQTPGGRRYSMVVTAVSLLGVYVPAIADLEDLQTLLTSGPAVLAAGKEPAVPQARQQTEPAALSVSYDTVRDRFNWAWAVDREGNDFDGETRWWWARDVRFDPDEVIADDDAGNLWSVPFTTDGEDAVTFAEPARVRQTFVPVAASHAASFSRPTTKPQRPAVAASNPDDPQHEPDPEGGPMDEPVRQVLASMGLNPDEATPEQIQAAQTLAAAAPETPPAPPEGDPPTDPDPGDDPEGEPGDDPASGDPASHQREPAGTTASRGTAALTHVVDRGQWEAMQAEIDLARRERRQTECSRFDAEVDAAVREGRIAPAMRVPWRAEIDPGDTPDQTSLARAQGAQTTLAQLPKGRVPLDASSEVPDPTGEQFPTNTPLPDNVSLLNPSQRAEMRARRGA